MAEIATIAAQVRERVGKGAARATRRRGLVPGVIYGGKAPPNAIAIDRRELNQELNRGGFTNRLYEVVVDGKKERVLPREVQLDPVTDTPIHVDFLRLVSGAEVRIMVPTRFVGEDECPGLRRGGVINVVRHEIELLCPAETIPEVVEIDLTGREIGESIHISSIALPEGVRPTIADRDFTVATIAAPTVHLDEAAAEAEEGEEIEAAAEAEAAEAKPEDEEKSSD